ncbi:MAG TPA: caspase family protein, partial [Polyangiales bacterium]|nr:caspase family protein [Polyangiales bacterium]
MRGLSLWQLLVLVHVLAPQPAAAQRYALTIGNNFGDSDEGALRWAEDDALRTRTLLTELGDVAEKNATMVLGVDADGLRHALNGLRERIAREKPGADSLLVAYYSGHGDADSLHLAGSRFPLRELEHWLRAIPVATLVTIVDACRTPQSGVRSKGAHHSEPFDVRLSRDAGPSGRVMITATGNDEVAQESDNLRSSFFTHHLLSGMRGAADR